MGGGGGGQYFLIGKLKKNPNFENKIYRSAVILQSDRKAAISRQNVSFYLFIYFGNTQCFDLSYFEVMMNTHISQKKVC